MLAWLSLLILRKRAATWILLGIWTVLGVFFAYVVPYGLDPQDVLSELFVEIRAAAVVVGTLFLWIWAAEFHARAFGGAQHARSDMRFAPCGQNRRQSFQRFDHSQRSGFSNH